jgi:hypothetical protein
VQETAIHNICSASHSGILCKLLFSEIQLNNKSSSYFQEMGIAACVTVSNCRTGINNTRPSLSLPCPSISCLCVCLSHPRRKAVSYRLSGRPMFPSSSSLLRFSLTKDGSGTGSSTMSSSSSSSSNASSSLTSLSPSPGSKSLAPSASSG